MIVTWSVSLSLARGKEKARAQHLTGRRAVTEHRFTSGNTAFYFKYSKLGINTFKVSSIQSAVSAIVLPTLKVGFNVS